MNPRCKFLLFLLAIVWLSSCEEEPEVPVPTGPSVADTAKRADTVSTTPSVRDTAKLTDTASTGPSVRDTAKPSIPVSEEPSVYKKFFVEIEYANHAWSDSHEGLFIDSLGDVIRYDLIPPGVKWDPKSDWKPNASETYTEAEIQAKIHHADTLIRRLSLDTLKLLQSWVFDTSAITYSDTVCMGADIGAMQYFKYLYQEDSSKYKRVPLAIHGDCDIVSGQVSANKIVALVDSLQYRYAWERYNAQKK